MRSSKHLVAQATNRERRSIISSTSVLQTSTAIPRKMPEPESRPLFFQSTLLYSSQLQYHTLANLLSSVSTCQVSMDFQQGLLLRSSTVASSADPHAATRESPFSQHTYEDCSLRSMQPVLEQENSVPNCSSESSCVHSGYPMQTARNFTTLRRVSGLFRRVEEVGSESGMRIKKVWNGVERRFGPIRQGFLNPPEENR